MLDIYERLDALYLPVHQEHLVYCLREQSGYYEGSFNFEGVDEVGDVIIDGKVIKRAEIIYTLGIYYKDEIMDYQTPFRDFVYLCFTDLADESMDIFELLEEIA